MLFSAPIFLFLFLPIVLAGYGFVGRRLRNFFLLGASIFYYAWGEGRYVVLLIFSIFLNFTFGILAARYRDSSKGRLIIWLALFMNLGALVWYKYTAFIASNINFILSSIEVPPVQIQNHDLPLGLSFFTFQAIAYVLDVYREETAPQQSLIKFALFMSLFPKLAAGPIIRHGEVAEDLTDRKIDLELFSSGVRRFVIGLGKKVLIADTIAKTTEKIFAIPGQDLPSDLAWLGIICYSLQIYFDFSGYSDMAIGLGRMLGFKIQENFNYPYIACSLTDFWRRWHISLSTWFRDYLFVPLSYALMTDRIRKKIGEGNYKTNYRSVFSIVMVFTLCGFWHGAGYNFIAWGMLHGVILGLESLWLGRVIQKWKAPLQHAYLLFIVTMAWVLFRSPGVKSAFSYFKALAGFTSTNSLYYHISLYLNTELLVVLLAGVVGAAPISKVIRGYFERDSMRRLMPFAEVAFIIMILLASFASLAGSTFSPFIYQKF